MKTKEIISILALFVFAIIAGGSSDSFWAVFAITVVLVIILLYLLIKDANKKAEQQKQEAEERRKKLEEEAKNTLTNHSALLGGSPDIVISYGKIKVQYFMAKEEIKKFLVEGVVYDYNALLNFQVKDNSSTIFTPGKATTKTNTGSMLGRAVVGGVLTGGVGAVIGATSASKETVTTNGKSKTVHDYSIVLTMNDLKCPTLTINLHKDSEATEKIASVLSIIINKNKELETVTTNPQDTRNESTIDALAKLAELKEKGLLSEDEFQQQKQKLLDK